MIDKIKNFGKKTWKYFTEPFLIYTDLATQCVESFFEGFGLSMMLWVIVLVPYCLITKQKLGFVKK